MADEEVRISSSMDGDLEAALARLATRVNNLEEHLDDAGRAGRRAGEGIDAGMGKAERATDKAGRAAGRAAPPIRKAGDEISKAGAKGAVASTGIDRFASKMQKAKRSAGGLGSILSIYKWAGIATGIYALAGGVSALGAGAVMALGGLAPMVGALGAVPTLLLGARLAMLAVTLASKQLEPSVTRMKNQFTELGGVIARGGLRSGMDYFANSLSRLAKLTGGGLAGLGAEIGGAARAAGDLAKSPRFLNQVAVIFAGLRPILANMLAALMQFGQALINIIQATLPMVTDMSAAFLQASQGLNRWTAETLANGKLAAWFTRSWILLSRVVGVLVDFMMGLFAVFRIGAGYATDMGLSVEEAARRFRAWTDTAAGQARINQYFRDSLPALHEMGRLVGGLVGGLAGLGANQNVASLLKQINDELGPALGRLISSFVGPGGLGPALISAAAALADFFAQVDFSILTLFAQAIADIARGIIWVTQNVPGASGVVSGLLSGFLAFKLLGPVFSLVAGGAKAFAWISTANKMTGDLSMMQKYVGGIFLPMLRTLGRGFISMAASGVRALITLSVALFTTPIGWIILGVLAIVAVLILLWMKCAWFRDAVHAVWEAIKAAFFAVVNALKIAWFATIDAIKSVVGAVVGFLVGIWQAIVSTATAIWAGLIVAWRAVWSVLGPIVKVVFNIIKFIVQTVVFIIMALITLVAVVAERLFLGIIYWAKLAWNGVLKPIFTILATVAVAVWNAIATAAQFCWNLIVAGASWVWNTILKPILDLLLIAATAVWLGISTAAQFCWNLIVTGANWLWTTILQPIFAIVGQIGSAIWGVISGAASAAWNVIKGVWEAVSGWFSGIFDGIGKAANSVWEGIKTVATGAADVVRGVWEAVLGILKGIWNAIANVWNGIPSVTVPDWVPLIGGTTFSLPKMPVLFQGGPTPGGPALVGEQGPEQLVRNGRVVDVLGARGPEVANLPRGGYVVPNLSTVLSGMAKPLPRAVANAVAKASPRYAAAGADHDSGLAEAVRELSAAMRSNRPLVVHGGEDTRKAVLAALRDHDREQQARGDYSYQAGRG